MRRAWLTGIYTTLAIVFAIAFTRLRFMGFPDISLSLFSAMSINLSYPASLVLAVVLGLLAEGLYPTDPWITPLMYVLLASASLYARQQMNLRGWPLALYFLLWGTAFKLIPPLFHRQGLNLLDAICGSALTGLLAYLLYIPWKEE
ncbi:MAG: hypothetical protein ACP5QG_06530 [candidate division WOR-3 bacterium]